MHLSADDSQTKKKPTKYFVDLDNTLCYQTIPGDYSSSVPIPERIERLHRIRERDDGGGESSTITIWTARGQTSGINYMGLTLDQLARWNVPYDTLSMQKPSFDVLIDDKSFNVDELWPRCTHSSEEYSRKCAPQEIAKVWGKELVIANNERYCGKILYFTKDHSGSMHYHLKKQETWYIVSGRIMLSCADPQTGKIHNDMFVAGDVVTHMPGEAHQVYAYEDTQIFEVSSPHEDSDTYRMKCSS